LFVLVLVLLEGGLVLAMAPASVGRENGLAWHGVSGPGTVWTALSLLEGGVGLREYGNDTPWDGCLGRLRKPREWVAGCFPCVLPLFCGFFSTLGFRHMHSRLYPFFNLSFFSYGEG
jgi:hypothetical protein